MLEKEPKFDKKNLFSDWATKYMGQLFDQIEDDEDLFESKYAYKRVYHHMTILENHPEMHNPDSETRSLHFLLDEMKKGMVPKIWIDRIEYLRFDFYLRVMNDEVGRYPLALKMKTLRVLKKAVKNGQVPEQMREAIEESINQHHTGCLHVIWDWVHLLSYLK